MKVFFSTLLLGIFLNLSTFSQTTSQKSPDPKTENVGSGIQPATQTSSANAVQLAVVPKAGSARQFYVKHPSSKVVGVLQAWLKMNGFNVSQTESLADYIISSETIDTGPETLLYFSLVSASDGKLIGQSKTRTAIGRLSANFEALAQDQLKTLIGKIDFDKTAFSISLSDTAFIVVRPKKLPMLLRSNVVVSNLPKDAKDEKATSTLQYYLRLDVPTTDIEIKGNDLLPIKTVTENGSTQVDILINADTTIKDKREYKGQLFYQLAGKAVEFKAGPTFNIILLPEAAKPEGTFQKNELILFAGTTYDHFNPSNKISGLSIEPMVSLKFAERIWARFGVYVHPNFSRDTSSSRRGGYYRLNDQPLKSDTSLIGISTDRIAIGQKVHSIGFYGDLFWTPKEKSTLFQKGMRLSPGLRFEFIKRTVTPTVAVTPILADTIVYNESYFKKNNFQILPNKFDERNVVAPKYIQNQFIIAGGLLLEADVSNIYLYFQPMGGVRFQTINYFENIPIRDRRITKPTLGVKFGIRYKNIISMSIDSRDFLSQRDEYLNISFGVPITIADLTKK